jgi:hypothetical protein
LGLKGLVVVVVVVTMLEDVTNSHYAKSIYKLL